MSEPPKTSPSVPAKAASPVKRQHRPPAAAPEVPVTALKGHAPKGASVSPAQMPASEGAGATQLSTPRAAPGPGVPMAEVQFAQLKKAAGAKPKK